LAAFAIPLLAPVVVPPLITAATVALGAAAYVGRELFPEEFLPQIPPNLGLLDQLGKGIAQVWGQLSSFVQSLIPPYEIEAEWERVQFVSAGPGATGSLSAVWIPHPSLYDASVFQTANIPADAQLMLFSRFSEYSGNYYGMTYEFMWNGGYGWLEAGLFNEKVRFGGSHAHLIWPAVEWVHTRADGSSVPLTAAPFVGNPPRTKVPLRRKAAVLPQTKAAVTPLPLPNPSRVIPPITEDQPNDTPQPLREFQPQAEPTPAKPKVVPSVFPSPVKTTPTQPDGKPVPVTAAKPTPTPKDAHVVNNQIIPANGPQPSLDGIAKEVGRIESKMASVMKSKPLKDPLGWDEIISILRFLKDVFDGITDDEAEGVYEISSPCELDGQGRRIIFESTIAESTDKFGAIINRINAVADLLQHSKNLKQPLCPGRRFPVSGQAVTVNFTQID